MKLSEVPIEISESQIVGEFMAINFMRFILAECPDSTHKEVVLKAFENRQIVLFESEI